MAEHSHKTENTASIDNQFLKKSRFSEMLIEANALEQNGFDAWLFCQGMQFASPDKWWGDRGRRDYPHEGIDLCLYRDRFHGIGRLNAQTRIPAMQDGVVQAVFKDYIGHAVIIEHEETGSGSARFLSMYAHTKPMPGIDVGVNVKQGQIIATIAGTRHSKAKISPHLHFSLGLPSAALSYDGFVWNSVRKPEVIRLLDPLAVTDWPHVMLDAGNPACREL